jgi:hypothetical protein
VYYENIGKSDKPGALPTSWTQGGILMDFEKVKAFLEQNKDNAEVAAYMKGLSQPTADSVKDFLANSDEGKALWQDQKDRYFNKGLETWKKNNLPSLVDARVSELYPEETEEQKRIKILEKQLEEKEKEQTVERLKTKALSVASEKKLPTKFIDKLLGQNEEETLQNLAAFEEEWNGSITAAVEGEYKRNGYDPGNGNSGAGPVKTQGFDDAILSAQIRQK